MSYTCIARTCIGVIAMLGAGGTSWAATRTVGQSGTGCPSPQYTTIGAAVKAASAGDVIAICPGLYPEQLIINKPLTLRGISTEVNGLQVDRVLVQPALQDLGGLATEAVITVINTSNVTIQNLALDASNNSVSGCSPSVADIHFYNASGTVDHSALFGAELSNPQSCTTLPFGNGFGVRVDSNQPGPFHVSISNNSIHDYMCNGVLVTGDGITGDVTGNNISGIGPAGGVFQFGVFIVNSAVGHVQSNVITEGLCGTLSPSECIPVRSEGVTLRAVGDGTVVDSNLISNAQSGIFINGANHASITNNTIRNIQALSGMDIQGTASGGFANSVIDGNTIYNVGPIDENASNDEEGCGINEYSGTGVYGNRISNNTVNDAYCGVAAVQADHVSGGTYFNVLYPVLNSDQYPSAYPPPTEP